MNIVKRKKYDVNVDLKSLSFQDLIIWCCVVDEVSLRKNIKKVLSNNNFSYVEDDYVSDRATSYSKNELVNLLLVRGNKPNYCLVAHTDVCRDHTSFEDKTGILFPIPVVKTLNNRKILQDKNCNTQVGGDDRLGVAIILWCALHTNHDFGILFTTDEESGLVSASKAQFNQLNNFKLLIEIDRGNQSNQLVNQIKDLKICEDKIVEKLLAKLASIDLPRTLVNGGRTDVYILKKNNVCQNAINMTCGYHESYNDSGLEYIDLQEAEDTKKCIISFLEDHNLL